MQHQCKLHADVVQVGLLTQALLEKRSPTVCSWSVTADMYRKDDMQILDFKGTGVMWRNSAGMIGVK